jgi:hypothetical protein
MELSLIGALVCAVLMLLGYVLGAPVIVGLFASLSLTSTSIATLSALGGASPLIYTVFAALLVATVLLRKSILHDLGTVLSRSRTPWLVTGLIVYCVASAILFPRLFAGQTTVFVASRIQGQVVEVPLAPVSGNISQTGYFVLGSMAFFAISVLLLNRENFAFVRRGFFTWCALNATFGLVDFMAKLVGAGDVFLPIRTASYSLLVEVEEAGFSRITGGHAEASSFGAVTLACLAFAFTYWRRTRSAPALVLSIVLLSLLILSTSSTAYVGLAVITLPVVAAIGINALRGRLRSEDFVLIAMVLLGALVIAFIGVYDEKVLEPFAHLFQTTILDKPLSSSAQERTYWNYKSLLTLFDTAGLGVGFGSSRTSSWVIAVLSQIGLVGAVMMAALVAEFFRKIQPAGPTQADIEMSALAASARASALAGLAAASVAGGTADPGLVFFVSLAVVLAWRTASAPAMSDMARFHAPSTRAVAIR